MFACLPIRRSLLLAAAVWAFGPFSASFAGEKPAADAATAYSGKCALCHGGNLEGGGAPPLRGLNFKEKWSGNPDQLAKFIQEQMPPGAAQPLDLETSRQVALFVLAANGVGAQAGQAQAASAVVPPAFEDDVTRAYAARLSATAGRLTPVTDAMLQSPPKEDWLIWRGDLKATGYSSLKQIDRRNAGKLRLVWSKTLGASNNGITPLAHDGVLFLHGGAHIWAIDAASGDTIWSVQDTTPPRGHTQPRGVALYGDAVYASTVDNHTLALDAKTGKLLWKTQIEGGGPITAAPLVANGKVFQGVPNCAGKGARCLMAALDATTGKELWRFWTIPAPGDSAAASWKGVPSEDWSGAGIWTAASYDAARDQVIFGTGNSYAIGALLKPDPNDPPPALYTNTTLKLDAKTGKVAWYFQHVPGDVWDQDWGFERMIIDDPRGSKKPVVITMGKLGILDALDLKTGQYRWSVDMGLQNTYTAIDPKTGAKQLDKTKIPREDRMTSVCPFAGGARNWPATAYDPEQALLFVPMNDTCMKIKVDTTTIQGSAWVVEPRPGSDHNYGLLQAVDLRTGKPVWTVRRRAPAASAVLATAGGLIFEGSRDRYFRASDSATGETLWQVRLSDTPNSFPITYMVDGKQYVAVVTGGGTYLDALLNTITPEIEVSVGRQTLWVFALD